MIKEYDLNGIRTGDLNLLPDERGAFAEIYRNDWKEFLGNDDIVQASLSMSFPGIILGWHRHIRGQVDYVYVIQGTMKIVSYDGDEGSPTFGHLVEIIAIKKKLQVVRIPGNYWHTIMTIGNTPSLMIYAVSRLYDYKNPDELRKPWDDQSVIPNAINGKTDDYRAGKPWRWDYPPHK